MRAMALPCCLSWLVALLLAATADVASARSHPCGIYRVFAEGEGVRIRFRREFNFPRGVQQPAGAFSIVSGTIHWATGKTDQGLFLVRGRGALLTSGAESYCFIDFAEISGHAGVNVTASFTPPGTVQTATEPIRAEDVPFASEPAEDQTLLVHFQYSPADLGAILDFEQRLRATIDSASGDQYDSSSFAGSEGEIRMRGPSADQLLSLSQPMLPTCALLNSVTISLVYGSPDSKTARRKVIGLGSGNQPAGPAPQAPQVNP